MSNGNEGTRSIAMKTILVSLDILLLRLVS